MSVVRFGVMVALVALGTACAQGTSPAGATIAQKAAASAPPTAVPVATPVAMPTPAPPQAVQPPPAPAPQPAISLTFAPGSVTVSVIGIANGAHQVHVHRDCTGNPNLHITTLGDVFVNPGGSGSRTFSLAPSLRGRGFDLLVYPLGASQGPPNLCAGI